MAGDYGIQYFHSAGSWQPFGAYQHMAEEDAMAQAEIWAKDLYAYPLGVRVTGPKGWKSDRLGGREEITLSYDPVIEEWAGECTKCTATVTDTKAYAVTGFARSHKCEDSSRGVSA
jgi:hypothetical protein